MQCSHCQAELPHDLSVTCPREADGSSGDPRAQSVCFLSIPYPIRSLTMVLFSTLAAFVLFRVDGAVWPLYLFVSLFVIGMFAIIFSRTRAAGHVAAMITITTTLWFIWEIQDWLAERPDTRIKPVVTSIEELRIWADLRAWQIAMVIWIAATLWALYLGGNFTVRSARFPSTYFLTILAFTLGIWGTFGVMITQEVFTERSTQWTLGLAILTPVVFLFVLLVSNPPDSHDRADAIALISLIAASYLTAVQTFANVIDDGLLIFLPKLLGQPELPPIELLWLDDVFRWRSLLAGFLMAITFVALLVESGQQALGHFRSIPPPAWHRSGRGGISSAKGLSRLFVPFAIGALITGLVIYKILTFVATTIIYLSKNILQTAVRSFRYVVAIVAPLLLVSGAAIMIILIARDFTAYLDDATTRSLSIWSESFIAFAVLVMLAFLALAASPNGLQLVRPAIESATYLGGIFYAFLSISALVVLPVLWWATRQAQMSVPELKPGTIWVYNNFAMIGIAILSLAIGKLEFLNRVSMHFAVTAVAAAVIGSAILGVPPIVDDLQNAFRTAGASVTRPGLGVDAEDNAEPEATTPAVVLKESPESTDNPTDTRTSFSTRLFLPTSNDVPSGFKRTEDGNFSKAQVVDLFLDSDDASTKLDEWGWSENSYRTFELTENSNSDPDTITVINVSVHRLGSRAATSQALPYFAEALIQEGGFEEVTVELLGDKSLALKGSENGLNSVVIYVSTGNFLIRIGGSTPVGDPSKSVLAVAKNLLE